MNNIDSGNKALDMIVMLTFLSHATVNPEDNIHLSVNAVLCKL